MKQFFRSIVCFFFTHREETMQLQCAEIQVRGEPTKRLFTNAIVCSRCGTILKWEGPQ